MLKHRRLRGADGDAAGPDEQEEPGPSSSPQLNTVRLEIRYASQLVSNKLPSAVKY